MMTTFSVEGYRDSLEKIKFKGEFDTLMSSLKDQIIGVYTRGEDPLEFRNLLDELSNIPFLYCDLNLRSLEGTGFIDNPNHLSNSVGHLSISDPTLLLLFKSKFAALMYSGHEFYSPSTEIKFVPITRQFLCELAEETRKGVAEYVGRNEDKIKELSSKIEKSKEDLKKFTDAFEGMPVEPEVGK